MKKFLALMFVCICFTICSNAKMLPIDTLSYNKKVDLPLLGKIWGFLKYHHPSVTKGQFDWDGQFMAILPEYESTINKAERNKVLLKWINSLGAVPTYPVKDSMITNVKLRPDLSWINSGNFSPELLTTLNNLKNNHAIADQHYVKFMSDEGVVFQSFINEPSYSSMRFPSYRYRLLAAFRYWNMVAYWYPYRYLAKQNWDNYLSTLVHDAVGARDAVQYARFIQQMVAAIGDSHAVIGSVALERIKGKYQVPFTVKVIEGKAVVNAINADYLKGIDLQKGYIIESFNGQSVKTILKNIMPYVSASTKASTMRDAAQLLTRTNDTISVVIVLDNDNKQHMLSIKNIPYDYYIEKGLDFSYQRDSSYFVMKNKMLYINTGKFAGSQISSLKSVLNDVKGVIFDNRQYPSKGIPVAIADLMLPRAVAFARYSTIVKGYPGMFKLLEPFVAGSERKVNNTYKIAIIVNEQTQSSGEFYTMFLRLFPNAVVVGSETSGADGNVIQSFMLPGGFSTKFTGLGVYYPDGRETQQVGVVPDVKVSQTIKGYREHKDELLDKAVEVILAPKK